MVLTAEYTWPDGSCIELSLSDGCDTYSPTRLGELRRELVGMLREIRNEPHPAKQAE